MNYSSFRQGHKKRLLLTKEGLDKLKKKLDEITARRHRVIKELQQIDKSDTDELQLSTEIQQLEKTEAEAAELNDLLQHVEPVIKPAIPEFVATGCTVSLKCSQTISVYTIVCPLELDIENNKISEDSILGKAVLGKKVGDTLSITTPKGSCTSYQVVSIR